MRPSENDTRILIVDDDEEDYLIVRHFIYNIPNIESSIDWAATTKKAAEIIREARHDIYLIDYRIGETNGLELLAQFDLFSREQPFIILTGAGDENVERQAMKMGVADYLVKGSFDSDLLSRVLRHSMQRKQMEVQRVQQLVELNRSKDEFIALASHQLRTPATAIKQYVSMVLEEYAGPVNDDQRALLQHAYDGNERQIQIVNDILRVAKLDLEKIALKRRSIDAIKKMHNVIRDVRPQINDREQKLQTNMPDDPVPILVDPEYIRMALSNILDNASKYTPRGKSISIAITELKDQAQVAIIIRDEGVGIAKEDLDKLFKKFSRIDNPLSVQVGGTGLGLYWSKEIIELHGGSVTVSSTPGKGSTFTITLPSKAS